MPEIITSYKPLEVAIIGGGFCGIMTAIHLVNEAKSPLNIHLINAGYPLAKGVAYSPYSAEFLLNVPNGRMSAFPDQPAHFVNWMIDNGFPGEKTAGEVALAYSARTIYGKYLSAMWNQTIHSLPANITVNVIPDQALNIDQTEGKLFISLKNHRVLIADLVVLATGNALPRQPLIHAPSAFSSEHYFHCPWDKECVQNLQPGKDVLIIGTGLTMADVVWGLNANGFDQKIYAVSTHGYNVMPVKENKLPYINFDLPAFFKGDISLLKLLNFFNRHRKAAGKRDLSLYPLIDALRPYNQRIWQSFSPEEKRLFYKRLKHMWDNARHLAPLEMHALIEKLKAENRLIIHKARLVDLEQSSDGIEVTINIEGLKKTITAERVINCTGPENHLRYSGNELLKNLESKGMLCMDDNGIGLKANPADGAIIDTNGTASENIFTIGTNLKGVLWESTAIPELREQAKNMAKTLLAKIVVLQ